VNFANNFVPLRLKTTSLEKQINSVPTTHHQLDKEKQNKIINSLFAIGGLLFFATQNLVSRTLFNGD
jgi:hypothetical protein